MKKTFLFLIVAILATINLNAQTALINGDGPTVENYHYALTDLFLMNDTEEEFVTYSASFGYKDKFFHNELMLFDKQTNTVYEEILKLPNTMRFLYGKKMGDYYSAYYYEFNKKNMIYSIYCADKIQDRTSNGEQKIVPEKLFSLSLDKKSDVYEYVALSPDKSKFALVFMILDSKDNLSGFYAAVYNNEDGTEIWKHEFAPKIQGSSFLLNDVKLSDKGEVLCLMQVADKDNENRSNVQLISCYEAETTDLYAEADFNYMHSMKLNILKNGNATHLGELNHGERTAAINISGFTVNKSSSTTIQRYRSTGLSYEAMLAGGEVYLFFTDNLKNYDGSSSSVKFITIAAKTACMIMTKIASADEIENNIVLLPNKAKKTFGSILNYDKKKIYFGLEGKKAYNISYLDIN